MHPRSVALDPTLHSPQVIEIKRKLLERTVGMRAGAKLGHSAPRERCTAAE